MKSGELLMVTVLIFIKGSLLICNFKSDNGASHGHSTAEKNFFLRGGGWGGGGGGGASIPRNKGKVEPFISRTNLATEAILIIEGTLLVPLQRKFSI